jgi:23S rRNA pseudouridine2605 synthase
MNSRKRISLARALSKLGHSSRSRARPLIEGGHVTVNGERIRDPEARIDIERDHVVVDGVAVEQEKYIYVVMHKPAGVVTTASDERGRRTVSDLLADAGWPRLSAVGRLDMESEGLLLFTNDTRWANRISAPDEHVDKVYHVQIDRVPDVALLESMQRGIDDRGERLKAKKVDTLEISDDGAWLEITLDEGKNRHIRRLLAARDVGVLRLIRVQIGPLKLGKLKPGALRELTADEVALLSNPL